MTLPQTLRVLLAILFAQWIAPVAADTTVVILRHGEKPALGLGQLTCKGLNRALALPALLVSRYGHPAAIYAVNPAIKKEDKGIPYAYVRPLATIEPLAIREQLPVNVDWGMTDITPLAEAILQRMQGTQVVAWEHHWAESLARQLLARLGGDQGVVPTWDDDDYDSIYVLRIVADIRGGRSATFSRENQGLNSLAETCGN